MAGITQQKYYLDSPVGRVVTRADGIFALDVECILDNCFCCASFIWTWHAMCRVGYELAHKASPLQTYEAPTLQSLNWK